MSYSLWPHGLQHAMLPCPSLSPGICSNSCPLSQWCHSTISSSVIPFSSCLQSFPASGSFPLSQLFASGGQSIEASTSAPVLPMNSQGWFPLGLTGLISLQFKGLSRVFSNTTVQKHQFFGPLPSLWSNSLQPHELQLTRLPCPSLSPGICSNSCSLSQWYHPTISSSVSPFSFCLQGLFQWVNSLHQVTKVLELQLQHQSFQWIFTVDFI